MTLMSLKSEGCHESRMEGMVFWQSSVSSGSLF